MTFLFGTNNEFFKQKNNNLDNLQHIKKYLICYDSSKCYFYSLHFSYNIEYVKENEQCYTNKVKINIISINEKFNIVEIMKYSFPLKKN